MSFSGEVSDKNGTKLPNVHIVDVNRKLATLTNREGAFLLDVNNNDTVRFSFMGFKTRLIVVQDLSPDSLRMMSVIMTRDIFSRQSAVDISR